MNRRTARKAAIVIITPKTTIGNALNFSRHKAKAMPVIITKAAAR